MQEGLATEHGRELVRNALEQLLDRRRVANERDRHLEPLGRDVTDGRLDIVRDPLNEVGRVLVLHVEHLLVDLLHRHAATEHDSDRQVTAVARVRGGHHVLGIEHLLRELRHRQGAVLLRATRRERRETDHEEVQTRERHKVDGELAQISVELTGETQAGSDARHDGRDEVVEVAVGRGRELERAEANVVERLVVNAERLVRVLDELVHRERRVVGLNDRVRDLGRRHD
ncbi:hypothetical protein AMAG_19190 [Allomyces macrogynus ATCC 38327]|uniref:Uncharacterized protein n=1 Tax=Allomyces macrogynus (strain ATCC 38327) TaxID=578462 RepID=A0A0L0SST2_ALLM3|nr:hypothetical protein AMAG_19190 [Allomyces macrogynus ATCC 38327]|eukprot:KNE65623.1 hypothetical protein AMAG_19190 [Allomyces macrogynus ATCC 38327]